MRYEHLELDLTTAACDELYAILRSPPGLSDELWNLRNELRARLQRRDQDPKATDPLMR
jgi:hypothetical protein